MSRREDNLYCIGVLLLLVLGAALVITVLRLLYSMIMFLLTLIQNGA